QGADDAFEQGRLAGAVRPHDRQQRALVDLAVEVMHGRVTLVPEREIRESQCRAHEIAQCTAAHSSAISTAAAASRSHAESRRIESDTVAGACGASPCEWRVTDMAEML